MASAEVSSFPPAIGGGAQKNSQQVFGLGPQVGCFLRTTLGPEVKLHSSLPVDSCTKQYEDSVAFEIEGRLLLLPKDHLARCVDYLASSFSNTPATESRDSNIETDCKKSDGIRKIDMKDLLPLLLPLHPPKPVLEEASTEPTKDSTYYLDTATFEVEGHLFVIPKHHFLQSSIFGSNEGDALANFGERPLKLFGVLKTDFQALLKLLHPSPPGTTLSQAEWESVLKLSTKWKMLTFRHMALENMSPASMTLSKRVLLGREHFIPEWLRWAYIDFAVRQESLSFDEFGVLGLPTALDLSQKIRKQYHYHYHTTLYEVACQTTPYQQAITLAFQDEIHEKQASPGVVERILLARDYGVSEWLFSGYVDLGQRREDISPEEAERLGRESTVAICGVREKVKAQSPECEIGFDLAKEVDAIFEKELSEVRSAGLPYYDPPRTVNITLPELPRVVSAKVGKGRNKYYRTT